MTQLQQITKDVNRICDFNAQTQSREAKRQAIQAANEANDAAWARLNTMLMDWRAAKYTGAEVVEAQQAAEAASARLTAIKNSRWE